MILDRHAGFMQVTHWHVFKENMPEWSRLKAELNPGNSP